MLHGLRNGTVRVRKIIAVRARYCILARARAKILTHLTIDVTLSIVLT